MENEYSPAVSVRHTLEGLQDVSQPPRSEPNEQRARVIGAISLGDVERVLSGSVLASDLGQ